MKKPTLVRALTSVLFAMLLTASTTVHGVNDIEVTTTVSHNPINICTDTVTVKTKITQNNPLGVGNIRVIAQTFPKFCTINVHALPSSCPTCFYTLLIATTPAFNTVYYYIDASCAFSCEVEADVTFPCNVEPAGGAGTFMGISYAAFAGTTLTAPSYPLQILKPGLQILGFFDDAALPIQLNPNAEQKTLISPKRHRYFDIRVDPIVPVDGPLTFYHSGEFELQPALACLAGNFTFTPFANGAQVAGTTPLTVAIPQGGGSATISAAQLTTWFNHGGAMFLNESIRVTNYFDVFRCSQTANDQSVYSIEWPCLGHTGCNSDDATVLTTVVTSSGSITPIIKFEDNPDGGDGSSFDWCGRFGSDLLVCFTNSTYNKSLTFPQDDLVQGSAIKTLNTISYFLKTDIFLGGGIPIDRIFLEGSGTTLSIPVDPLALQLPSGFYNYFPLTHTVVLDFNTLQGQYLSPLGPNGPLTNGFIPEGYFGNPLDDVGNEFQEGAEIWIRYKNITNDCLNALFYPDANRTPPDYGWRDCNKPGDWYMFFGNGSPNFDFAYTNMCGTGFGGASGNPTASDSGNLRVHYPVTAFAESDKTDLQLQESAKIDFYYQYADVVVPTDPPPSPFAFIANAVSTTPAYFSCVKTTWQATINIPDYYELVSVNYNPDPDGGVGQEIAGNAGGGCSLPVWPNYFTTHIGPPVGGDNIFTFKNLPTGCPSLSYKGRITLCVTLTNCPDSIGGSNIFTTTISAYCGNAVDDCLTCANTIACITNIQFRHCPDPCANLGGEPPQSTYNFEFYRDTFGWTAPDMATLVTPGPCIATNRVSNCDLIIAESEGSIDATATQFGFLILYMNPEPSAFQFFDVDFTIPANNYLTYGGNTHYIQQNDLSDTFQATSGNHFWPANGSAGLCLLWVNFPQSVLTTINAGGVSVPLKLHMVLKVKPMIATPDPGFWKLEQVRGGFWTESGQSCDDWGQKMLVQNYRTVPDFRILDAKIGGLCERTFNLRTTAQGGIPFIDNYPCEYRPRYNWADSAAPPSVFNMVLPPTVGIASANYIVYGRSGFNFPTGYPVDYTQGGGGGQTVNFETYSIPSGAQQNPWDVFDADGWPHDIAIIGTVTNFCPAEAVYANDPGNPIGDVELRFSYTNQLFASDPDCRMFNPFPKDLPYSDSPTNWIELTFAPTPYHVVSNPSSIPVNANYWAGLKYAFLSPGCPGCTIKNAWVKFDSNELTVNKVCVDNGPSISADSHGYFQLGDITEGAANAAHITLKDVTLNPCKVKDPVKVRVEGGYSCTNYPTVYPPLGCCQTETNHFEVIPDESDLVMIVTPPVNPGPCGPFTYMVHLASTGPAYLGNPGLALCLSPGASFVSATYTLSSGGSGTPTLVTGSPCDVFDLNLIPEYANGMSNLAFIDLEITITGICGTNGFSFGSRGTNLCGANVPSLFLYTNTFTVVDTDPPVFTNCPTAAIQLPCNSTPTCASIAQLLTAAGLPPITVGDACSGTITTIYCSPGPVVLGVGCQRSQIFTNIAADACHNTNTCEVKFEWTEDLTGPVFMNCPTTKDLGCNPTLPTCLVDVASLGITAFDLCSGNVATIYCSPGPVVVNGCQRSQIFTNIAADACLNTNTCEVTYTWTEDTTPPAIICPPAVTVQCIADVPLPDISSVTAIDDCLGAVTVMHVGDVSTPAYNFLKVTIPVSGSSGSGLFTSPNGNGTITATTGGAGPFLPNNNTPYPSHFPNLFGPSGIVDGYKTEVDLNATYTVTFDLTLYTGPLSSLVFGIWNITEETGSYTIEVLNSSSLQIAPPFPPYFNFLGSDDDVLSGNIGWYHMNLDPPTGTLLTSQFDSAGTDCDAAFWDNIPPAARKIVVTGQLGATVPDDVVFYFAELATPCPNHYTITRTYKAEDMCGNVTNCTQSITVDDQTPPSINCPGPLAAQCDIAQVPPYANYAAFMAAGGSANDNCAVDPLSFALKTEVSDHLLCPETVTRTYRIADLCGNEGTCTQIIIIDDTVPPTLACPGPLAAQCDIAQVPPYADYAAFMAAGGSASDNCAVNPSSFALKTEVSDHLLCPETVTRTYRIADLCGNEGTCTQIIIIDDTIAPVMACGTIAASYPDQATAEAAALLATGATDDCPVTMSAITVGTCNVMITVTATDLCGNFGTCIYSTALTCSTNCCDGCVEEDFTSYSVTVYPGLNYLVNHLCNGTNNLAENVLLNMPNGVPDYTQLYHWNEATQSPEVSLYDPNLGGWDPLPDPLPPGEGFILSNPTTTAYTLTFYGCEPTNCPPPCAPTNGYYLVGQIGLGTPTYYSNLFSCPPECGTHVILFDGLTQTSSSFDYVNGAWIPQEPMLGIGQSAFVTVLDNTNCCCKPCLPDEFGQYPVSYTVTINPGFNFLVNHLCRGTNNLADEVLPVVPDDTVLYHWNEATQTFEISTYTTGLGWDPSTLLNPGQGFILNNPNSFSYSLTFEGCEPTCPPPCMPTNGLYLIGQIGTGSNPTYYSNLFTCPPKCGTQVSIYDPSNPPTQPYDLYDYVNGVWIPSEPMLALGQSAYVTVLANTNCCTNTNEFVFNGSFEVTSPIMTPNSFYLFSSPDIVPGWTTAATDDLEIWCNNFFGIPASEGTNHLEINAGSNDQTVTQVVTGLKTNCPATFCFDYTGRNGLAGVTPNNDFTVTLSGGFSMSLSLDPAEFSAGGWTNFCTNFVPTTTAITIKFRGQPHVPAPGGAHIDNVSLTQCCPPMPCTPVSIFASPQTQAIAAGPSLTDPVTFTAVADGSAPFTFYWRRNGATLNPSGLAANGTCYTITIAGNTSTLTLTCVPPSGVGTEDSGTYSVVAANYWCCDCNKLSGDAMLVYPPIPPVVFTNTTWRYRDDGSDQGTAWQLPGFNDSTWASGLPLFGFETSPALYPWPFLTPLPVSSNRITYYFRTHFDWSGSTEGVTLTASNYIDDGAVFYLNGREAGRVRMPANPVLFDSLALSQSPEGIVDVVALSASNLITGDNVLAVEVHQGSPISSDIVFGMTLDAHRSSPANLTIIHNANGTVTVSWSEPGYTLQEASNVTGPWTSSATQTSPVTLTPGGMRRFFRLSQP